VELSLFFVLPLIGGFAFASSPTSATVAFCRPAPHLIQR
jgi:hypothetical protein